MTFDIDDARIQRELASALFETNSEAYGTSALQLAVKRVMRTAGEDLDKLLAAIIAELIADPAFRATLQTALAEEIQVSARAKVGSTVKALPRGELGPLLKGLAGGLTL